MPKQNPEHRPEENKANETIQKSISPLNENEKLIESPYANIFATVLGYDVQQYPQTINAYTQRFTETHTDSATKKVITETTALLQEIEHIDGEIRRPLTSVERMIFAGLLSEGKEDLIRSKMLNLRADDHEISAKRLEEQIKKIDEDIRIHQNILSRTMGLVGEMTLKQTNKFGRLPGAQWLGFDADLGESIDTQSHSADMLFWQLARDTKKQLSLRRDMYRQQWAALELRVEALGPASVESDVLLIKEGLKISPMFRLSVAGRDLQAGLSQAGKRLKGSENEKRVSPVEWKLLHRNGGDALALTIVDIPPDRKAADIAQQLNQESTLITSSIVSRDDRIAELAGTAEVKGVQLNSIAAFTHINLRNGTHISDVGLSEVAKRIIQSDYKRQLVLLRVPKPLTHKRIKPRGSSPAYLQIFGFDRLRAEDFALRNADGSLSSIGINTDGIVEASEKLITLTKAQESVVEKQEKRRAFALVPSGAAHTRFSSRAEIGGPWKDKPTVRIRTEDGRTLSPVILSDGTQQKINATPEGYTAVLVRIPTAYAPVHSTKIKINPRSDNTTLHFYTFTEQPDALLKPSDIAFARKGDTGQDLMVDYDGNGKVDTTFSDAEIASGDDSFDGIAALLPQLEVIDELDRVGEELMAMMGPLSEQMEVLANGNPTEQSVNTAKRLAQSVRTTYLHSRMPAYGAEMRTVIEQLRALDFGVAHSDIESAIFQTLQRLERFESIASGGKLVALCNAIEQQTPNTWAAWWDEEGVVVLGAVLVAVAAASGIGAPIAGALVAKGLIVKGGLATIAITSAASGAGAYVGTEFAKGFSDVHEADFTQHAVGKISNLEYLESAGVQVVRGSLMSFAFGGLGRGLGQWIARSTDKAGATKILASILRRSERALNKVDDIFDDLPTQNMGFIGRYLSSSVSESFEEMVLEKGLEQLGPIGQFALIIKGSKVHVDVAQGGVSAVTTALVVTDNVARFTQNYPASQRDQLLSVLTESGAKPVQNADGSILVSKTVQEADGSMIVETLYEVSTLSEPVMNVLARQIPGTRDSIYNQYQLREQSDGSLVFANPPGSLPLHRQLRSQGIVVTSVSKDGTELTARFGRDEMTFRVDPLSLVAGEINPQKLASLKEYMKTHDIDDSSRIALAEALLGRTMDQMERDALIAAHNKPGVIDELSPKELAAKTAELRESSTLNKAERRLLIEAGLAGERYVSPEAVSNDTNRPVSLRRIFGNQSSTLDGIKPMVSQETLSQVMSLRRAGLAFVCTPNSEGYAVSILRPNGKMDPIAMQITDETDFNNRIQYLCQAYMDTSSPVRETIREEMREKKDEFLLRSLRNNRASLGSTFWIKGVSHQTLVLTGISKNTEKGVLEYTLQDAFGNSTYVLTGRELVERTLRVMPARPDTIIDTLDPKMKTLLEQCKCTASELFVEDGVDVLDPFVSRALLRANSERTIQPLREVGLSMFQIILLSEKGLYTSQETVLNLAKKRDVASLKEYMKTHDIDDSSRIALAEALLGRTMDQVERDALIAAHNKPGVIDELSPKELAAKTAELRESSTLNKAERRLLIEAGLVGVGTLEAPATISAEPLRMGDALNPEAASKRLKDEGEFTELFTVTGRGVTAAFEVTYSGSGRVYTAEIRSPDYPRVEITVQYQTNSKTGVRQAYVQLGKMGELSGAGLYASIMSELFKGVDFIDGAIGNEETNALFSDHSIENGDTKELAALNGDYRLPHTVPYSVLMTYSPTAAVRKGFITKAEMGSPIDLVSERIKDPELQSLLDLSQGWERSRRVDTPHYTRKFYEQNPEFSLEELTQQCREYLQSHPDLDASIAESLSIQIEHMASFTKDGSTDNGLNYKQQVIVYLNAKKVGNKDRISLATDLLGRALTPQQQGALLRAHKVGMDREGASIGNYTDAELFRKGRILMAKDSDGKPLFSREEADLLLETGLAGIPGRIGSWVKGLVRPKGPTEQQKIDEQLIVLNDEQLTAYRTLAGSVRGPSLRRMHMRAFEGDRGLVVEKRVKVSPKERDRIMRRMLKEGYEFEGEVEKTKPNPQYKNAPVTSNEITLRFVRPFRENSGNVSHLIRLTQRFKNPGWVLNRMKSYGINLEGNDLEEGTGLYQEIIEEPSLEEFLDYIYDTDQFKGPNSMQWSELQNFCRLHNAGRFEVALPIPLSVQAEPRLASIEVYLRIADNPKAVELLDILPNGNGEKKISFVDTELANSNVERVLNILKLYPHLTELSFSEMERELAKSPWVNLISDPEQYQFMNQVADNWNVLEEFAETFGFSQSLNRKLSEGGSVAGLIVSDTSLLALMQDSEFRTFCNHLVQEYKFGMNAHVLYKNLAPLWKDNALRARILSGEGAELAKHYFCAFSSEVWHGAGDKDCWQTVFDLQEKYPELSEQINALHEKYGFRIYTSTLSIIARSDTENMNDKEYYRDKQEQLEDVRRYLSDADFRSQFTEDNPQLRTTVRMLSENAGYSMRLRDVEILSSTDYSTGDDALVLKAATVLHSAGLDFHIIERRDTLLKIAKANFEGTLASLSDTERKFVLRYIDVIIDCEPSKRMDFVTIFKSLSHSPSSELRSLDEQLALQLIDLDNPLAAYQEIASVFEQNNLPIAAKITVAFQVLYPANRMYMHLQSITSPEILNLTEGVEDEDTDGRQRSARRVQDLMIRDLMLIHVRSGENSLREFLESSSEIEELLLLAERDGVATLSTKQQEVLHFGLLKLETLLGRSRLGQRQGYAAQTSPKLIEQRITALREVLGAESQQTATDRLAQIFLRPLGIHTVQEAIDMMSTAHTEADTRNRAYASRFTDGSSLELSEGDMMHGAGAQYLGGMLSRGLTCGEMLGAQNADSDATPFDADFGRVLPDHLSTDRLETPLTRSPATGYANCSEEILFLFRNRGQFDVSRNVREESPMRIDGGYETFHTPHVNDSHFGIRTGLPSSEIDGFIVFPLTLSEPKVMAKIYIDIVEHGVYIPIFNVSGKLVFTSEQFDAMRRNFVGLDARNGAAFDMAIIDANTSPELFAKHSANIDQYVTVLRAGDPETNAIGASVQTTIETQLATFGVEMKSPLDHSLGGARLFDIGSTGRGTYLPGGGYDFDYTLRIDDSGEHSAFENVEQIAASFGEELGGTVATHPLRDDGVQLRIEGCIINGKPVDVDIAIMANSEINYMPSHEAVEARFEHIRRHHGEGAYLDVQANILLAKQVLKDGKAYKKVEHGGFGGIGVENWILANGGNFVEACSTFKEAALGPDGKRIPLDEFKKKYSLLNPGVNFRDLQHDDYIRYLTEDGYINMLIEIEKYLGTGEVAVSYQAAPEV